MKIRIEIDEGIKEDEVIIRCRNLSASSVVAFEETHKQVYVSRNYYKPFISKLEEKRLHYEK